jgi:hypothetical protein
MVIPNELGWLPGLPKPGVTHLLQKKVSDGTAGTCLLREQHLVFAEMGRHRAEINLQLLKVSGVIASLSWTAMKGLEMKTRCREKERRLY